MTKLTGARYRLLSPDEGALGLTPQCISNRKESMRNLKILGLALVAMLAMSAMGAATAPADTLTSELNQAVNLTGTTDEGVVDKFTITAGNTSCKHVQYHIGTVKVPTTTITATPTYQECTSIGFPATIDMNGCDYTFHITGGTLTVGDVEIICLPGQEITVTAVGAGTPKCTIHVPPQTLSNATTPDSVTYKNIKEGVTREITVEVKYGGLKYSHTGGSGVGACPTGSGTTGNFEGKGVLTATNHANTAHVGLFLSNL